MKSVNLIKLKNKILFRKANFNKDWKSVKATFVVFKMTKKKSPYKKKKVEGWS